MSAGLQSCRMKVWHAGCSRATSSSSRAQTSDKHQEGCWAAVAWQAAHSRCLLTSSQQQWRAKGPAAGKPG